MVLERTRDCERTCLVVYAACYVRMRGVEGRTCRSYRGRVSAVTRQSFVSHVGLDESLRVWREARVRVYAPTADVEVISLIQDLYVDVEHTT